MISESWLGQGWQLGLAGWLAIVGVVAGVNDCAFAQIEPDATLGTESSVVTPLDPYLPGDGIEGGAIRGANLFHSFLEFNVDAGRTAYFFNSPGIENILARVTGGSRSEILGQLSVSTNANLFLINPNGIIFGRNASLDVGGAFVATTANAIQFGERGFFSASAPNVPSVLLSVNPSAFLFNQIATKAITNQSVAPNPIDPSVQGLRVTNGKSLLLLGGDVQLEGGQLQAAGGRVELGGVAGAGSVGLNIEGNNLRLSYPEGVQRADVSLTNGARLLTSGERGGNIQVQGRQITLTAGSGIEAPGGTLTVTAEESVEVTGGSGLLAQTEGAAAAGDLRIETGRLIVQDGAQVGSGTFGSGQGGTLMVTADEFVQLIGTSADGTPSGLFTQTESAGAAGALKISTARLIVRDGAQVSASSTFGEGQGGTLVVNAKESIELTGTSMSANNSNPSGLFAGTEGGSGVAGDLRISTKRLIVQGGAQVSAFTRSESQQGRGTLAVTAKESIELTGTAANGSPSALLVGTEGGAAAGDLKIETGRLIVQNGARISAATFGQGSGGDVQVQANSLLLTNGSSITSRSEGQGNAGNIQLQAGSLTLDDKALISAETATGEGGNITLQVPDLLLLRRNSQISTTAGTERADGNGGDIDIDTQFIVSVPSENSDITANAFQGKGGLIQITAQGVFGIERREQLTPLSDITAFSQQNPVLNGVVEINTPDVDPTSGLVALPTQLVDLTGLIAQGCPAGVGATASKFVVTGRGGLPPNPNEALSSDAIQVDWVTLNAGLENSSSPAISTQPTAPEPAPIVEAQGWVIGANGEVVLTASAPTVTPNTSKSTPPPCHASLNVGFLSK